MSGLEIERKFLVKGDSYKQQAYGSSRIQQGYICSRHGRTVRVRIRDARGYLTIKGPSEDGGLSRYEFEKEITLEEARQLMKLCESGVIDKTRYLVKSDKHTFEVDEFYGENEGLVMAEVELGSSGKKSPVTNAIITPISGNVPSAFGEKTKNQQTNNGSKGYASGIGGQVEPVTVTMSSCTVFL